MSAVQPPHPNPPPAPPPTILDSSPPAKKREVPDEITIVSHSMLYYWWWVWACAFLMAGITCVDNWMEGGYRMAVVPGKSVATAAGIVPEGSTYIPDATEVTVAAPSKDTETGKPLLGPDGKPKFDTNTHSDKAVILVPKMDKNHPYDMPTTADGKPEQPLLRVSHIKGLGIAFVFVLLVVVLFTNVPLRGMWSVLVVMAVIVAGLLCWVFNLWETLLTWLWLLDIRINMGGYLTIAIALLAIWLVTFFLFDRQRYITFAPGQFRVKEEIGGGEQIYDAGGLSLQKERSSFFLHTILGLGAGDLIVKTAGAQAHHFDLPNVTFIHNKIKLIEDVINKRIVESQ